MAPKKLTSTRRHSIGDRKVHLFKTPLSQGKRLIKNELENNHHTYSSVINCTDIFTMHKDIRSIVITNNNKSHILTSETNRRKHYRKIRKYHTSHLVVTPASELLLKISSKCPRKVSDPRISSTSKRPRELSDPVQNNPKIHTRYIKKRRIEANAFKIENIVEVNKVCLKKLFDTNTDICPVIPDQNENLLSVANDYSEYRDKMYTAVQSNIEPVLTSNMDMLNDCRRIELRLQKIPSPIDVKFDLHTSTKIEDKASAMCGMEMPYVTSKEEVCTDALMWKKPTIDVKDVKPAVVVKTENEVDEIEADQLCDPQTTIIQSYPGQLLLARYQKYPYWPAIVCAPDTEETRGKIQVKFFADKGTGGMIKKENAVEFHGIDSFVQYKKAMTSKLSKTEWKSCFTVSKKAKAWAKAVVEITFILSKNLDNRLALFDIIVICTLRDTIRNSPSLSQLISEHASPSQLEEVKCLFADNPNIFEDVKQKLAEISSVIEVESLTRPTSGAASSHKPQSLVVTPDKQPHSIRSTQQRRQSLSLSLTKRRVSTRLASIVPTQLSVSLPIEPQKCKEKVSDRINRKEEKRIEFEKALELYKSIARQKEILFKGLRRGKVCKKCLTVDENLDRDLVKCSGDCVDHVHRKCAHTTTTTNDVRCHECFDASSRICYTCKRKCSDSAVRCVFKSCGRYYHNSCLDDWLQTKTLEPGKVICPTHTCHTCASDDPRNTHFLCSKDSTLSRCIKCPTTFHADSSCIPAGVKILTANQHICIRHRKETRKPVSLNWCYICGGRGGKFLCCESCPLTSHFQCLNIDVAAEHYFCVSCETGRHPLHGEVVWTKYLTYPWWPAVIVPPACIPSSTKDKVHNDHDLCVRFFGTYEFGWVGRSFVYLYDEGDAQRSGKVKYDEAVAQAENWYKTLTIKEKKSKTIQPLPYTKIGKIMELAPAKLTKSKRCDPDPCSCSPNDTDPCGPTSNCDKREAWTECDANVCPTGDKCQNQSIGKRKYASFRQQYLGDKGFGLIAETFICQGTMIIEYVGELVTEAEFQSRLKSKQTKNSYFMKYGKGLYIDAEKKGNMARFMNHSCNPNCHSRVIEVKGYERIGLIAAKNIKQGEELTFNYDFNDQTHKCYCGEAKCRGFI